MSGDTKRAIACALFGAATIGALATSYLHVAEFFLPVIPTGWPGGRFVAALAIDVLAAACSVALIVTPGRARGRAWMHAGLWGAVALSVWANWRYASVHVPAGAWAADAFVSALLPVLAVIATHALAAVLAAVPPDADDGPAVGPTPDRPAVVITREEARRVVTTTGRLPAGYTTGRALARAVGVDAATVSRWMDVGRRGDSRPTGMGVGNDYHG